MNYTLLHKALFTMILVTHISCTKYILDQKSKYRKSKIGSKNIDTSKSKGETIAECPIDSKSQFPTTNNEKLVLSQQAKELGLDTTISLTFISGQYSHHFSEETFTSDFLIDKESFTSKKIKKRKV